MHDSAAELVDDHQAMFDHRKRSGEQELSQRGMHGCLPLPGPSKNNDSEVSRERIMQDIATIIVRCDEHDFFADSDMKYGLVAGTSQTELFQGDDAMTTLAQERDRRAAQTLIGEKGGQTWWRLSGGLPHA